MEALPERLAEGTDALSKDEALSVFTYMSAAFERLTPLAMWVMFPQ